MVKLASSREARTYGPRLSRNRAEYVNAGLYLFAAVVLLGAFAAELFSAEAKSGLVVAMIGLVLIAAVNLHDLVAHMAGFDFRVGLMEYDLQLAAVEFAAPLVQALGSVLFFLALLFLLIQEKKDSDESSKLERHAVNMLIAGPVLWVVGSIHNSCQIYERAEAHLQILQQAVHVPFLLGSVLFTIGAILNAHDQAGSSHHGRQLLGVSWAWLGLFGTLFFILGGFMNLVKVFKMQQGDRTIRLEKLRGGAQELLSRHRDGQLPLITDDQRRRRRREPEDEETAKLAVPATAAQSTPYKDVLVGHSQF